MKIHKNGMPVCKPARIIRALLCPEKDTKAACGLCYGGAGAVSLRDEIVVDRGAVESLELRQILSAVVGAVIDCEALPERLCVACTEAAVASYKFMQLCRGYSEVLSSLARLVSTTSADVSAAGLDRSNASGLFLVMGSLESTVVIDKSARVADAQSALKRFNRLIKRKNNETVRCNECNRTFSSKVNIEKHLQKCPVTFHRRRPDSLLGGFLCTVPDCYKIYPKASLLRLHFLRVHQDKNYPCSHCSKKFGSPALVAEHYNAKHQYRNCRVCGEGFTGRKNLWVHEKTHRELRIGRRSEKNTDGVQEGDSAPKKTDYKIICDVCGQKFPRIAPLRTHLISKHNFPKSERDAKPTNVKVYKCDLCEFTSKRRSYIRVHQERRHLSVERRFSCVACGKRFHRSTDLARHRATHSRERPELCTLCGKRFVNKAALLYHTRLHTGERPYECAQCGERFLSASRRGEHTRVRHGPRQQCAYCGRSFTGAAALRRHVCRQHEGGDNSGSASPSPHSPAAADTKQATARPHKYRKLFEALAITKTVRILKK